jgi:hypothetical protein
MLQKIDILLWTCHASCAKVYGISSAAKLDIFKWQTSPFQSLPDTLPSCYSLKASSDRDVHTGQLQSVFEVRIVADLLLLINLPHTLCISPSNPSKPCTQHTISRSLTILFPCTHSHTLSCHSTLLSQSLQLPFSLYSAPPCIHHFCCCKGISLSNWTPQYR